MSTALITVGAFALMMGAMAVGVMAGRKPLKGSCGGTGDDCACEKAGTPGACMTSDEPVPGASGMKAPGELLRL